MAKKKDEKPKSIDDLLDDMRGKQAQDLDAAFKAHDTFSSEDNQNHLYNNVFAPAQDGLYSAIKDELDKAFGDDTKKLHKDKAAVKKAVAKGLRKYFETVQPSLVKILDGMKMEEEDQYEFLVGLYDDHLGVGTIRGAEKHSLRGAVDGHLKGKKSVGDIKHHLYKQRPEQIDAAMGYLLNRHFQHHFGSYHPTQVAAHLKPQLEKAGFKIDDPLAYATEDLGDLLKLREQYIEKKGISYLKKKEEKK